ncbi:hypothetical protein [Nocardioides speluncae]|uniref:hypothetical protein n=1 Tax=Nocardioides speluncae TaxID=2670337 RepID=UPI000D6887EF|nr:hypothetical protein [Nocardioides speluncae]
MKNLRLVALLSLAFLLGSASTPLTASAGDQPRQHNECLVVDTDAGLDDYRAIGALVPGRDVTAVVVTEGISSVAGGATATSMFLGGGSETPPVIAGLTSPAPPDYDWLPAARAGAERLNYFLSASVPFAGDPADLRRELRDAVYGCSTVDVLVLGPWTSFNTYAKQLGHRLGDVVVSGLPIAENHPDNFNCEYDLAACRAAGKALRPAQSAVWVDLPPSTGTELTYAPTEEMVGRFEQAGLPGVLRAAMLQTPSEWVGFTRLWDDAAALYVLDRRLFARQGQHVEPKIGEDRFRELLIRATNAG